jgi:hypothetical protein
MKGFFNLSSPSGEQMRFKQWTTYEQLQQMVLIEINFFRFIIPF